MTAPTSTNQVLGRQEFRSILTDLTTRQNAVPIEPIRAGQARSQGVDPQESRVVPDSSAQGTVEPPSTSPTSASGTVPWKDQVIGTLILLSTLVSYITNTL